MACKDLDLKLDELNSKYEAFNNLDKKVRSASDMKTDKICLVANQIFKNIKLIAGGGSAIVYEAEFKLPNEDEKTKVVVALRVGSIYESRIHLKSLCKLSKLADLHICNNFANLFDYFVCVDWPFRFPSWYEYPSPNMIIMMEKVDGTLQDAKLSEMEMEAFAFEYLYSKIAFYFEAKMVVGDVKARNLGLKKVNFSRVYSINGNIYILPPGPMYKRIDFGDVSFINESEIKLPSDFLISKYDIVWSSITPSLEMLSDILNKQPIQLFEALKLFERVFYKFYSGSENEEDFDEILEDDDVEEYEKYSLNLK